MSVGRDKQSFPDVLDPTFKRIFDEEYAALPDELPLIFQMAGDLPPVPWRRRLWWKVCRPFNWLRWRIVDWLS